MALSPVPPIAGAAIPRLHAVGQAEEQSLLVPWSETVEHILATGTTRSGKTRLLEVLASGAIGALGAVVGLDPKGDRELLARCALEAHRRGKPFALITPAFPQQSQHMHVLDTAITPAKVSARIRALMPSGGARSVDPFYEEYPLALIECLASAQAALGHPFTKITSNLIPTFRGVVEELLGPLFSTIPADVTWSRIVEEAMVVYVALASVLLGDIANRIGRVILQDLVGYLE
jgi:hypothetical protein